MTEEVDKRVDSRLQKRIDKEIEDADDEKRPSGSGSDNEGGGGDGSGDDKPHQSVERREPTEKEIAIERKRVLLDAAIPTLRSIIANDKQKQETTALKKTYEKMAEGRRKHRVSHILVTRYYTLIIQVMCLRRRG